MLREEEKKLEWEYNVPFYLSFSYKDAPSCTICKAEKIRDWLSPFIVANVPYDKLVFLLKRYFDFETTESIIENHRKHIIASYDPDNDLNDKVIADMKIINAEMGAKIDEKQVLESALRSLHARKLLLEKNANYGGEWFNVVSKLTKLIELKLKMKGEIKEGETKVNIGDLIDVKRIRTPDGESTTTITAGKVED